MVTMEPQFENYVKKIDKILLAVGMSIDEEDSFRSLFQRLKYHWKFSLHLILYQYGVAGQIVWIVLAILTGKSLVEITVLLPCLTMCLLGQFRICFFLYHITSVHNLINRLKSLEKNNRPLGESCKEHKVWFNFLTNIINSLKYLTYLGATAFISGPFIVMASYYYTSGKIKLMLPFIIWYPFDGLDLHFWPLAYVQQTQAAWMAVHSITGPDCFFFTCCTVIYLQLKLLQQDLEGIIKEDSQKREVIQNEYGFIQEFVNIVKRHQELIRCVELLDGIFAESTLYSFTTSSLIICASGFDLKYLDDYALIIPFIMVLIFGMLQVYLQCYYGDYVARSSISVGDAIYNSRWYEAGAKVRKHLLIVLLRSQKPLKFRAGGFIDVNLMAFARILSSSWSYFALLNQMYQE